MNATLRITFVLSLVAWLGGGGFLSLAVLPTLFSKLDTAVAGNVASTLFSVYDITGLVAGLLLIVSTVALAVRVGPAWRRAVVLAAALLATQLYIALILHPAVGEARRDPAARAHFDSLHKRSVILNSAVLLGLTVLTATGATLLPRGRDGDR